MSALLADDAAQGQPWAALAASLRERDSDPAYADAPTLDAYARLSFNPLSGDLEKTDRQLSDVLAKIQSMPVKLGAILRDDNKSAWKRNRKRPGWDTLMDRLRGRVSNGVVAWHTDRLMRQPRDLEDLIDLGKEVGATVASCFGERKLDSSDDQVFLRIEVALACKASDDTSRRQKRKRADMREKGNIGGGPRAFGFEGKDRTTGEPVPHEQVEAERRWIRAGARKYLDGQSLTDVAREWNAVGLATVTGQPHALETVRAILARARNAGLIEHDGVIVGRALDVEPIFDQDTLEQVRAKLAVRRYGRPVSVENLGSGILMCGRCGKPMHSQPGSGVTAEGKQWGRPYADGSPRRQYRCSKTAGCGTVGIDQRGADKALHEMTLGRLSSKEHMIQLLNRSRAVEELDRKIDEAKSTAHEVGRRLADPADPMDLARYDVIMAPLDRGLADMIERRKALVAAGVGDDATVADLEALEALWEDRSPGYHGRRRALVRRAFPLGVSVAPSDGRGRSFDRTRITPVVP